MASREPWQPETLVVARAASVEDGLKVGASLKSTAKLPEVVNSSVPSVPSVTGASSDIKLHNSKDILGSPDEDLKVEAQTLLREDMDTCFKAFDKDEDGFLNQNEFGALCRALFRNERGKPYPVEASMLSSLFTIFDTNKDNVIDKDEFRHCWQKWIKQVVRPVTAFVVVDVQNDFISGSLAICKCPAGHDGEDVIPPINQIIEEVPFDVVVYSLDWHPSNHLSFIDNVQTRTLHESCRVNSEDARLYDTVVFNINNRKQEQRLWPRHCVQNTWGAELHKELKIHEKAVFVKKGTDPDTDSYSAFWDNNKISQTTLNAELQKRNITDVFVCGIAFDICVGATATHANDAGYRTILIEDACRGVSEEDIQATKENIVANHGIIVHSSQVKNLASGRDRPPQLGYKLALELSKKTKKDVVA